LSPQDQFEWPACCHCQPIEKREGGKSSPALNLRDGRLSRPHGPSKLSLGQASRLSATCYLDPKSNGIHDVSEYINFAMSCPQWNHRA
jgi:hypothetical protein